MSKTARVLASLLLLAGLAACGSNNDTATDTSAPLRVGATPVPHAEILEYIRDNLAKDAGLQLEIVQFTDFVQPNVALKEGQIDANYFQTVPYLAEQSAAAGYDFVNVGGVHLEPLGLYSQKIKDIADLPEGSTIAIPNDPTNGGRALRLLAANGLITLRDTGETSPSSRDITDNPKNIRIVEIEAAQLPRSLEDVEAAVINGNFAIEAGLNPAKDALILESAENNPNVNILVTRNGMENDPRIQNLIKLLQGDQVRAFIEQRYNGAVIPAT